MIYSAGLRKIPASHLDAPTTTFTKGSLEANAQQSTDRNFLHIVDEIQSLQVEIKQNP